MEMNGSEIEDDEDVSPFFGSQAEGFADLDTYHHYLRSGDLVELGSGSREPMLAVFVRQLGNYAQFYQMNGMWANTDLKAVTYNVPNFFDRSDLTNVLPYLPSLEAFENKRAGTDAYDVAVPREVGAELIKAMAAFHNEAEEVYRKHASTLDNAHQILAHPTDHTFGTLEKIAQRLLGMWTRGKPPRTQAKLYAVHRALVRNGFGFSVDVKNHRKSNIFQIRPKEQVQQFQRVKGWVRDYQEALAVSAVEGGLADIKKHSQGAAIVQDFVEKAQLLIRHSRAFRSPTHNGCVGPANTQASDQKAIEKPQISGVVFSAADRDIIRSIEEHTLTGTFKRYSEYKSLAPILMRAVGAYEGYHLGYSTIFMFLQEIGIIRPFENRLVFDPDMLLPGTKVSNVVERLAATASLQATDTSHLEDKLKDMRIDWGETNIYCIDNEEAKEIDDGLSLETIPGSDPEHWVHMHVANPSAFFDHTSVFAKFAGHQTETLYLPETTFPMLPRRLTQNHFSLARGRPVLTFSARLNENGDLLDSKITCGVIRKVMYITNRDFLSAAGQAQSDSKYSVDILVGGKPASSSIERRDSVSLTLRQRRELLKIYALGMARRAKRKLAGYASVHSYAGKSGDATVWRNAETKMTGIEFVAPHSLRPQFIETDPIIRVTSMARPDPISGGLVPPPENELGVSEFMNTACEIAALWCKARNIPGIYRCTVQDPDPDKPDPTAWAQEHVGPWVDKGFPTPLYLLDTVLKNFGRTFALSEPHPHLLLGSEAYTKVTSPLRRYADLFMHWQIGAALRQEHRTGKSLVGNKDTSYLPFQKPQIDQLLMRLEPRERIMRKAQTNGMRFWTVMAIFRAYYFKEAALPDLFTVYVIQPFRMNFGSASSWCSELDMNVDLLKPDSGTLFEPGDVWEAKIFAIDVYQRAIRFQATRLINKIRLPA